VFSDKPDATRVKIVPSVRKVRDKRGRVREVVQARVEITRQVKGAEIAERYFYFDEPPTSFDDIIAQTRKMLRDMPKGWYVLMTSTHGNIAAPMRKEQLISRLNERFLVYDKLPTRGHKDDRGLAEVVVGYKLVSFTEAGAHKEYRERLSRREIAARERKALRAAQRRRALRKLRFL
jgi:hypothetical protein